eukprot:6455310-Amphidinium_carterae.1
MHTIEGIPVDVDVVVPDSFGDSVLELISADALEDVDDVAANRVVDVEVDIEVELLDVVEDRVADVEALLMPLALLVLVKVEEIDVNFVLEVLGEDGVVEVEVQVEGDVVVEVDDVGLGDVETELRTAASHLIANDAAMRWLYTIAVGCAVAVGYLGARRV